ELATWINGDVLKTSQTIIKDHESLTRLPSCVNGESHNVARRPIHSIRKAAAGMYSCTVDLGSGRALHVNQYTSLTAIQGHLAVVLKSNAPHEENPVHDRHRGSSLTGATVVKEKG